MLKRYIIILLIFLCFLMFAKDVQTESFDSLENIILKRKQTLESLGADIEVVLNDKSKKIQIRANEKIIKEISFQTLSDENYGKIISFFLHLEEAILIVD